MKHVPWLLLGAGLCISAGTAFASWSTLLPTGAGTYADWTPSTGITHYTLVDETTCNGVTDYVRTTTVGHRDSFAVSLASIPDGSRITRIDVKPCASRQTGGGAAPIMKLFYRLNGVNSSDAGSYSLSGTTPTELASTSWTGLSITKTSTTTLETGALLFSGTKGARLSRLATAIEYATLPLAPTNLVSSWTNTNTLNVQLSWIDHSIDETGFHVEQSTDNLNFTLATTTAPNTTSVTQVVPSAGTYYYRVTSVNAVGQSTYSSTSQVTIAPPTTPTALAITSQSLTVVWLGWVDTSSTEQSFRIERSINGTDYTVLATTLLNTTLFADYTAYAGSTYYYRIASVNAAGMSAYGSSTPNTPTQVPIAPSGMIATLTSSSTPYIALTWSDNASDELGFHLERAFNSTTSFALFSTPGINTANWPDFTAASSTGTWYYRIRAFNLKGDSLYSNIASIFVP